VPPSENPAAFNAAGAPVIEFSVPDMMCAEGCGVAVKEILAKQPGVTDVVVDFDGKVATVAIEEGKFDADQALAALVDRQFTNSSLKNGSAAEPQAAEAVQ
jgi:copper chaperone CopZ